MYVPNLSEIAPAAAELLTINERFFVRFQRMLQYCGSCFKMRGPICTKLCGNIVRSSLHTKFKNGEDILLRFQTTAAQNLALVSDKAKNRTMGPPVKIRGRAGEMSMGE